MIKYDFDNLYCDLGENRIAESNIYIANELAEMNRLKRLEMSKEGNSSSEGIIYKYKHDDLEDKAL